MTGFVKLYRCVLAAAALLAVSQPAFAEKRVALVLGNAAYQNVAPLANPVNDSARIAATLKEAGFDVVDSRRDLPALETKRALRDFADRARDADIAVVYYAGHGIEVNGSNYLIPVDARLERDTDIYDEALSLDRVLIAIEPAKKLRLVILDACRDNPFAKSMKRTVATRAIGRGLAMVEPSSPNVLIAYSAKAGSTAVDGDGSNSPFTLALTQYIAKPGLDVRRAFGFVRDEVLKVTSNKQEPFVYGSLGGDDVPLVAAPAKAEPPAAAPALNAQAEARRDYELAVQLGNRNALEAFLRQYPDGFYASLARLQLDKIAAEEIRVAATEKARLAEQERARLIAEGAQKSEQSKAEADVRAAEQARVAAEQAKQVAQDQATAAEQKRLATESREKAVNLAALTPASTPAPADITKSVQAELRRVGCLSGAADGDWNDASQRSLTQFNRYAGTRLDTRLASVDALDAIKQKNARVCPLACQHGFEADGDRCVRITCAAGSFLNDDNECEKRRAHKPVARRDRPEARYDREDRYDRSERSHDRPRARRAPEERYASEPRRDYGRRSGAGMSAQGRPLTGQERAVGCHSYGAIMSGVCP
ncbi:MAG: caspase family protein [Rhizobiales bacterium]|nr:caspase family protein [Hyphomicrobiales bacterium]